MSRHGWTPPEEFDEYRLVRPIGKGGMGTVFLAHDTLLDRPVAVKFIADLEPGAEARERFLVEARAAARLQHPNVVTVYRVGEIDNRPYIISEYVRGESLAQMETPVPWQRALELGLALARGLGAAHRRGVLHRDIKPANAIVAELGDVKLLDFGLAKLTDAPVTVDLGSGQVSTSAQTLAPDNMTMDPAKPLSPKTIPPPPTPADPSPLPGATKAALAKRPLAYGIATIPPPLAEGSGVANAVPGGAQGTGMRIAGSLGPESIGRFVSPLTRAGAVMGTPYYMAPEAWRGEPGSRRSDIYSLGALLYELCSGLPPHADVSASDLKRLGRRVQDVAVPSLANVNPQIDPRFAAIVDRCLLRDPEDRFGSGDDLRSALEELAVASTFVPIMTTGNPYRGLHAFEAEHRALFFGRGAETRTLVERLRAESFVLVTGDSGVGKSSLCRAGVLPLVDEGALGEGRVWCTATMVPGRHPVSAFVSVLAPILGSDEDTLSAALHSEPSVLGRVLRKALGRDSGFILFVDQLEEVVTMAEAEEAATFGELVAQIASGIPGVKLLSSVRGDFLTRLASVPGVGPEISRAFYLLRPLTAEEIREAIVGPAKATGVEFESEELVEKLVVSTVNAEGGLPLLQFALAELWDEREAEEGIISARALDAIGGVSGALARHADTVLASMPPAHRTAARRVLIRMVTAEGTRARRTQAELTADDPTARVALDTLVRGRIIFAHEVPEGTTYEVAHEALLSGWATMRGWLDQQAGTRAVKERLEAGAAEWERLGRSGDAQWGGPQLAEVAMLDPDDLQPREVEFLAASRQAVRRKRLRRRAIFVGVPLALVATYAGVRIHAQQVLARKVSVQLGDARAALDEARTRVTRTTELRARAFEQFDRREREEAETVWAEAFTGSAEADRTYAKATQALETAYRLDATRRDVRQLLARVLYERAALAEREGRGAQRDELIERLRVYDDDAAYVGRWNAPGQLSVRATPAAHVTLEVVAEDEHHTMKTREVRDLGTTPRTLELPRGSYVLVLRAEGRAEVRYPLWLERGEKLDVSIDLPVPSSVPPGFVYVPPGRFLVGSSADETLRRNFFNTVPMHPAHTEAFLIGRHETTYAEWIEYLDALSGEERAKRTPRVAASGFRGTVALEDGGRSWTLHLQPASQAYSAKSGEPIRYGGRDRRAVQDWRRMPVSGVSAEDAEAYVGWLARSGRLPGARLCTDAEWERAARGADHREYPTGSVTELDDANFDKTYGKDPVAFGPDEVGSHPASQSPFGIDDLCGNVWEWVRSTLTEEPYAVRGGSYYSDRLSVRSTNREPPEASFRDITVGVRVCLSPLR